MPNSITLYDFTPNIEASYTGQSIQQVSYVDLINHRSNHVGNYAALDGMGIDLTDATKTLATTSDNIGAVSSIATVENGRWSGSRPRITIVLDEKYDLTKGISVWQHSLNDCSEELLIIYYDEDNEELAREITVYEELNGKAYNHANMIGYEVKSVTIEPTALTRNAQGFSTLKIDGVDFGSSVSISNIIGDVVVYGEIKLTKDDLPACSCDITVLSEYNEPQEGQSFELISDSYIGQFIIDSVSREGQNIYQISATDVTKKLDESIYNSTDGFTQYQGYESLLENTNVIWSSEYKQDDVEGYLKSGVTNRQVLAMYCAAANCYISAWKDVKGIHAFTIDSDVKSRIMSDRILGNSIYNKISPYKGVYLEIEVDAKYITILNSNVSQNNSAGYYKVTDLSLIPHDDSLIYANDQRITAGHIMEYLNGNEVTADIVYEGENIGDVVEIETAFNGNKKVVIESIQLTIGSNSTIASIVGKEVL
ncbi:MAG: hypothetical protein KBT27_13275 [Prevotellaceae bacterium]|nr:hypothetical protein [Candidatus Faecinaster equi]